QRWWHFRGRLHASLNDSLSGIRVVKAFAQEEREIARFNPRSFELALAGQTAEQTWMTVFPILSWVTTSGALLVWYVGGRQLLAQQISLGTLATSTPTLTWSNAPRKFFTRSVSCRSQFRPRPNLSFTSWTANRTCRRRKKRSGFRASTGGSNSRR